MTARHPLPAERPRPPGGCLPAAPDTAWSPRRSLPLRSAGLLACVPPGRVFADGGRLAHLQIAVALAATSALSLLFALYAVLQAEPRFLLLAAPAAAAAAAAGALVERRLLLAAAAADTDPAGPVLPAPTVPPSPTGDPEVTAALWARARRAASRDLVERDPALARDLRIGRPDQPHPYDDGGLVDVNSAPVVVLVDSLGLTAEEAAQVARVREHLGAFRSPDDLVTLAGLPQLRLDRLADRLVVVP